MRNIWWIKVYTYRLRAKYISQNPADTSSAVSNIPYTLQKMVLLQQASTKKASENLTAQSIVQSVMCFITQDKYKEATEALLQLLLSRDNTIKQILNRHYKCPGEDHTLNFLNPEKQGIIKKDSSQTPLFSIVKLGKTAGENFFQPFLTCNNLKIREHAHALLDKIVIRFKTYKTYANLHEFGLPLLYLLEAVGKTAQRDELIIFLKEKKILKTNFTSALLANFSDRKLEENQPRYVDDRGSFYVQTVLLQRDLIAKLRAHSAAVSINNEQVLAETISMADQDPEKAFIYLFQNGRQSTDLQYLKDVYRVLINTAGRIKDIADRLAALSQLREWVLQDQFKSINSAWITELEALSL